MGISVIEYSILSDVEVIMIEGVSADYHTMHKYLQQRASTTWGDKIDSDSRPKLLFYLQSNSIEPESTCAEMAEIFTNQPDFRGSSTLAYDIYCKVLVEILPKEQKFS